VTARVRLGLALRLVRATPTLPPAVAWFLGRALCVAIEELGLTGRRQDGMFVWRASEIRHPAGA